MTSPISPESQETLHELHEGFGDLSETTKTIMTDLETNPERYADLVFPTHDTELTAEHIGSALRGILQDFKTHSAQQPSAD